MTEEALPTLSQMQREGDENTSQEQSERPILSSLSALNSFEQRHVRMTNWVDRSLKARLDRLCLQQGRGSRSRLINEAIADLLRKYKAN